MRAFAMTGMLTASWMPLIIDGSDMRATPPSRRMSDGTRSSAMTAAAPESSAIFACSASTTSMMTPPFSISARPAFTRNVASSLIAPTMLSTHAPVPGLTARRLLGLRSRVVDVPLARDRPVDQDRLVVVQDLDRVAVHELVGGVAMADSNPNGAVAIAEPELQPGDRVGEPRAERQVAAEVTHPAEPGHGRDPRPGERGDVQPVAGVVHQVA